jgi:hypothetical protein
MAAWWPYLKYDRAKIWYKHRWCPELEHSRSNSGKTCQLHHFLRTLTSVTLKCRSNQKPGSSLAVAIIKIFSVPVPPLEAKPRIRSDQNLFESSPGPRVHMHQVSGQYHGGYETWHANICHRWKPRDRIGSPQWAKEVIKHKLGQKHLRTISIKCSKSPKDIIASSRNKCQDFEQKISCYWTFKYQSNYDHTCHR